MMLWFSHHKKCVILLLFLLQCWWWQGLARPKQLFTQVTSAEINGSKFIRFSPSLVLFVALLLLFRRFSIFGIFTEKQHRSFQSPQLLLFPQHTPWWPVAVDALRYQIRFTLRFVFYCFTSEPNSCRSHDVRKFGEVQSATNTLRTSNMFYSHDFANWVKLYNTTSVNRTLEILLNNFLMRSFCIWINPQFAFVIIFYLRKLMFYVYRYLCVYRLSSINLRSDLLLSPWIFHTT